MVNIHKSRFEPKDQIFFKFSLQIRIPRLILPYPWIGFGKICPKTKNSEIPTTVQRKPCRHYKPTVFRYKVISVNLTLPRLQPLSVFFCCKRRKTVWFFWTVRETAHKKPKGTVRFGSERYENGVKFGHPTVNGNTFWSINLVDFCPKYSLKQFYLHLGWKIGLKKMEFLKCTPVQNFKAIWKA